MSIIVSEVVLGMLSGGGKVGSGIDIVGSGLVVVQVITASRNRLNYQLSYPCADEGSVGAVTVAAPTIVAGNLILG